MKSAFILASILSLTSGTPVNTNPNTPGIVAGSVAAGIAALPFGGPIWINEAISSDRETNLDSTPAGYLPVAIGTAEKMWGSKEENVPLRISYQADPRSLVGGTKALIGISKDRDNFWDTKISAVNVDTKTAPGMDPFKVPKFTRYFNCTTGDRIVPAKRAYLFIKVDNGKADVDDDILSERFMTVDNRFTAHVAGSFYTIQCRYDRDVPGEVLPIRRESRAYSNSLPA